MPDETAALLRLWEPGMTVAALKRKAAASGALGRATALRVEDIVGRVFADRYLRGEPPAASHLKTLLELGVPWRSLMQLLLLYTARANPVLADFLENVYWRRFAAGALDITRDHALDFLTTATAEGAIDPPWSDIMMIRVARYLTGCLTEFGLAGPDRAGIRQILPFRLDDLTALYLAHELHFSGINDTSLVNHPDWRLFGLEPADVPPHLVRTAGRHFILQGAGDLVRIAWQYRSFEEALRGIAANRF